MRRLVECVVNVSEGRDPAVLDRIAESISGIPGAFLLSWSADFDHHRSVYTFVGEPESVFQSSLAVFDVVIPLIDMREHRGIHPRMGAVDVVPFVPLKDVTMDECVVLAHALGRDVGDSLEIPVYLYGFAAPTDGRRDLAVIRRGEMEVLREQIGIDPERRPDYGPNRLHPTAGASAVGARDFLIAFNVFLETTDLGAAREIAFRIRERDGGLPAVKALGFLVHRRNQAQVSMNLTDYQKTSLASVYEVIQLEAGRLGVELGTSEVVGHIPRAAFEPEWAERLRIENYHPGMILEECINDQTGWNL
jgi:glutamate formiminotransferase